MIKFFSDGKRIAAGFLAVLLLGSSFSACSKGEKANRIVLPAAQALVYPGENQRNLHLIQADGLSLVAASGLIELYFDPATYGVAVKETSQNKWWYALPSQDNGRDRNDASILSAVISKGDQIYRLNSQDNSVAFGTASYELKDNGMTVTYVMADSQQTASKADATVTGEDVRLTVSIHYELKDGSLFVSYTTAQDKWDGSAKPTEISVLEYFGAAAQAEQNDFILVPDGSGALIHTGWEDPDFQPVTLQVYGPDAAVTSVSDESAHRAQVGVYGMKQGNSAFAVLIEQGEAVATIAADRSGGQSGYDHVGARFSVVPTAQQADGTKLVQYTVNTPYSQGVKLCYRFLPGNTATYAGMSVACREQLIRDGILSTKTMQAEEYLPFLLTTVGSAVIAGRNTTLTAFSQAQDMVTQMKAKGINNIYLRYQGALSGGLNQKGIDRLSPQSRLGGKKDFTTLYEYMKSQKLSLYLDVNLLSSADFGGGHTAKGLNGSGLSTQMPALGEETYERELLRVDKLEQSVLQLLGGARKLPDIGYCVNDAGSTLYSDFSSGYQDRQSVAKILSEQNESLSMNRNYMVDTGNFYMIKNADVVVNLPLSASHTGSDSYEPVPFLQMLLHGIVNYAGAPVNLSENPDEAMLRAVEYGACPSYEWIYESTKKTAQQTDLLIYDQWLAGAAKYYTRVNTALGDLQGAKMTRHEMLQEGVYLTEYDSSSIIYVNYTENPVTVDGVTVAARDFLRIN